MEFKFENGNEIYKRTRLQVGPLYLSSQSYAESTHRLSRIYTSHLPITSLYFTAIESVPEAWLEEDGLSNDNFLRYSLLIGTEEYPITPGNRGGNAPVKYYINSAASTEAREELAEKEGCGFIDSETPITTWQLKAKLTRPANVTDVTPVISGYRFTYTYE